MLELLNFFIVLFDQFGQFCVILELEERPTDDIFWIHILQPLTINHHICVDVEAT
jgi:hypothetical protein